MWALVGALCLGTLPAIATPSGRRDAVKQKRPAPRAVKRRAALPQCKGGSVYYQGRCVCPQGSAWDGYACAPVAAAQPPPTGQPVVPPGSEVMSHEDWMRAYAGATSLRRWGGVMGGFGILMVSLVAPATLALGYSSKYKTTSKGADMRNTGYGMLAVGSVMTVVGLVLARTGKVRQMQLRRARPLAQVVIDPHQAAQQASTRERFLPRITGIAGLGTLF